MSAYPDLSGQNIFITGAARGLGKSMALKLAACGATVAVADLVLLECEAVADEIRAKGGQAHAYVVDVAVRKLFMAAAATFAVKCGRIDAVINNAMLLKYEPVEQISDETLTRMTAIGINGSVWGAQALLAHYDAVRGGNLINMASPVAEKGFPNTAAYSAVKGAIVTLTKVLAAELGPRNIRVNTLAPGGVDTEGTRTLGMIGSDMEKQFVAATPLGRIGQPDDIGKIAVFLASDQSGWVTGERIVAAGGFV